MLLALFNNTNNWFCFLVFLHFCSLVLLLFVSAGTESILEASGRDATETFLAVHSLPMLEELLVVGILE